MTLDDIIHDDHNPLMNRIVGIAIDDTQGSHDALEWGKLYNF